MDKKYEGYFKGGSRSPEQLAQQFLKDYFDDKKVKFPINPFQMLSDLGIVFALRPFKNYEGIYIPASDEEDMALVGINLKRPITRQRYTAAHELCHHIKDATQQCICTSQSQTSIEKYAEDFAAELLMPGREFRRQVDLYSKEGFIDLEGVLKVADYFGVSFKACLNRIAYRLHMIKGDTSPKSLNEKSKLFKPLKRREELGLSEVLLYEQLVNAVGDDFDFIPTPFTCQKFKHEYVYFDSRMEGVEIGLEKTADIVTDLMLHKQASQYCTEENKNIIEVAGLSLAYDYAFNESEAEINIYEVKHLNEKLFSTAPCPEFGGRYRESNTLVLGAKFETVDYQEIQFRMLELDKKIQTLMEQCGTMSNDEYIETAIRIHHELTIIHAFRDGNGRTSRAFLNMMLLRKHLPPVFFKEGTKTDYKKALEVADKNRNYDKLYEVFYKEMFNSFAALTEFYV